MIHKPDRSLKRIKSCLKRCNSFAEEGTIDLSHPLSVAWSNCKMFLDHRNEGPCPKKQKKIWNHKRRKAEDMAFDIICLDWFALKLDDYAKANILKTDKTVSAILYEWRERLFFNPEFTD